MLFLWHILHYFLFYNIRYYIFDFDIRFEMMNEKLTLNWIIKYEENFITNIKLYTTIKLSCIEINSSNVLRIYFVFVRLADDGFIYDFFKIQSIDNQIITKFIIEKISIVYVLLFFFSNMNRLIKWDENRMWNANVVYRTEVYRISIYFVIVNNDDNDGKMFEKRK